jgi:hypothetical protein
MEVPVVIDGRNIYDPADARHAGLEYHSMGRESTAHVPSVISPAKRVVRRKHASVQKANKLGSKVQAIVN